MMIFGIFYFDPDKKNEGEWEKGFSAKYAFPRRNQKDFTLNMDHLFSAWHDLLRMFYLLFRLHPTGYPPFSCSPKSIFSGSESHKSRMVFIIPE
jgi:hypothetical protein